MLATDQEIARAAELIRQGQLVAFPTETVYGLGANALDVVAVERIYKAKERPWASPVIVHVSDENMARSVAANWPPLAQLLARRFWPGPLTLIVKKAEIVPDLVTAGLDSVGIRVPAHPVALALIQQAGVPIAAPSANRFSQISPTTAEHVRSGLGDRVDMILDGGPTRIGIESTVVSLTRNPPAILRPGMISLEQLEAATAVTFEREVNQPRVEESPGQHPRHYAPRTPFYLLDLDSPLPQGRGRLLDMPATPEQFAAELYTKLHSADGEGWEWIAVRKPAEKPEWVAIADRLRRASASE